MLTLLVFIKFNRVILYVLNNWFVFFFINYQQKCEWCFIKPCFLRKKCWKSCSFFFLFLGIFSLWKDIVSGTFMRRINLAESRPRITITWMYRDTRLRRDFNVYLYPVQNETKFGCWQFGSFNLRFIILPLPPPHLLTSLVGCCQVYNLIAVYSPWPFLKW